MASFNFRLYIKDFSLIALKLQVQDSSEYVGPVGSLLPSEHNGLHLATVNQ